MTSIQQGLRPFLATAGIIFLSSGLGFGAEAEQQKPEVTKEASTETEAESERKKTSASGSASSVMVVTATMSETETWKTASSVTVIDRKKIEQEQYRLLPDALRQVPGLTLADRGSPGLVTGVFLRGTKSEHTAVLIDGRPVPANLAGSFNLETTPLDNVERVEVLKGPASSLYGGKTIGGVINIITRSGRGLEKPVTTGYAEAGSYGTFREGISTLGDAGAFDWALDFGRADVQGHRLNSQFQMSNAAGRLGYDIAESLRFELDLRYYNADVGVPGAVSGFGANDPDDHVQTEFWSISPRVVWDTTEQWRQTLTFSTTHFRQAATHTAFSNNRITVRNQFMEYQSEFRPTDNWTITGGLWMQDMSFSRFNDGTNVYDVDEAETNMAVYLQTQIEVLSGLNLVAGTRFDHYSDFGDEATWRAGLSYRVPVTGTLLHANYGTAFAPPSAQDYQPALSFAALAPLPEKSRGFEIGIEQPFANNRASASLTWFRNDIENLIEYDPFVPPFGELQQIDQARTQGLEAGLNWRPTDRVGFDFAYTYLDAENVSDDRRLVRRPRHTLNGGVWVRPVESVRLGLSARYVIDREDGFGAAQADLEDYLNVRLTANWQVRKGIELFARVENLLGEEYQEVLGFPAYRTAVYAGVKFVF